MHNEPHPVSSEASEDNGIACHSLRDAVMLHWVFGMISD